MSGSVEHSDELAKYQALIDEVAAAGAPYPAERFAGRGIVIPAGGARMFTCAWVAVRTLRDHLGTDLPIEVWHIGDGEMSLSMKAILEDQGVAVIDAQAHLKEFPAKALGGWELKPYAIMNCRFREVLLLDADNVPVRDPAFLFEAPKYREAGCVFWPDIVSLTQRASIWEICGVEYRSTPSFETGQIVIDKAKCWHALQLTKAMNDHSDFFYRHVYGDKDTFLLAWLRLAQAYAMPKHPVRQLPGTLCQHDFDGNVLFQHRNRRKWTLEGINPSVEGFDGEDRCFRYLDELRGVWNGKIFQPPAPSKKAEAVASEIEVQRWFTYEKVADSSWPMEFLTAHRIGRGHGRLEAYWWVQEAEDDALELAIGNGDAACLKLRRDEFGVWRGRWNSPDAARVDLMGMSAPPETAGTSAGHNHATGPGGWKQTVSVYEGVTENEEGA